MMNRRKILFALAGLILVSLAVITGFNSVSRLDKTAIHIEVFPTDADIALDEKPIKSGTLYLEKGTYEITSSKQGFEDYSKTLVVSDRDQTLGIILKPVSEEAFSYGEKNEEDYLKAQAAGERAALEAGKEFNEKNPIAKHLPYKTFFYSIGYRMDQSDPSGNSIIIEIDASDGYRQTAIYQIRQLGFDPTDFNINFRDYENPFPL